jgi:demethylmenaquinone methyltransferase/2-methoxy-6-polyprenyl-1,4-benzoquinol methylase
MAKSDLVGLYRRRSRRYDLTANLYYLIGFREHAFRRRAVAALDLHRGDTVVEIGCGTGLNFKLLRDAVGSQGRVVGIDLTEAMLDKARRRVARHGWSNVEFVHADADQFELPDDACAVISTFALTLMPRYDDIIRRSADALPPGGRMAVLDFKGPEGWPHWLVRLGVTITSPFGVTADLMARKPWESMKRWFADVHMKELFWGSAYICVGAAGGGPPDDAPSDEEESR